MRGYASAVGLDQQDWTERFLEASGEGSQKKDEERGWVEFASNVGKARIQRSNAMEHRLRWIGVILLILVVAAGAFLGCATTACAPAGGQTFCLSGRVFSLPLAGDKGFALRQSRKLIKLKCTAIILLPGIRDSVYLCNNPIEAIFARAGHC